LNRYPWKTVYHLKRGGFTKFLNLANKNKVQKFEGICVWVKGLVAHHPDTVKPSTGRSLPRLCK